MPMKAYACPRCLTLSRESEDGDGGPHECNPTPWWEKMEFAIRKALGWFYDPDENALTQFERIGELFYRETGHLRPGKDDPREDTSSFENQERFRAWFESKSRESLAALRESIKP